MEPEDVQTAKEIAAKSAIGELYRIKELYRVQGENVCWIAKDLLVNLKQYVVLKDTTTEEKMHKLEEAINLFEGV